MILFNPVAQEKASYRQRLSGYNNASGGTWDDWDVSGEVQSNSIAVQVYGEMTVSSNFGYRKNGSSRTLIFKILDDDSVSFTCEMDTNKVIECYNTPGTYAMQVIGEFIP